MLIPTKIVNEGERFYWIDKKTGKQKSQSLYDYNIFKNVKNSNERSLLRSKTFNGIAVAMANQWG